MPDHSDNHSKPPQNAEAHYTKDSANETSSNAENDKKGTQALAQTKPSADAEALAQTKTPAVAEALAQTKPPAVAEALAQTKPTADAEALAQTKPTADAEALAKDGSTNDVQPHPPKLIILDQPIPTPRQSPSTPIKPQGNAPVSAHVSTLLVDGEKKAMETSQGEIAPQGSAPDKVSDGISQSSLQNGPNAEEGRPDLIGKRLADRYTLLEQIDQGGMSVVYLARHELLNKQVAIKVLKKHLAHDQAFMSRFHREAKAAASISDPHIVDITDYGLTDDGEAFIVMEYLKGQSLNDLIAREGALPPLRVVRITRQILHALSAAHAQGIIHRDLKAENVFLLARENEDFVKLLDFGISKILHPANDEDRSLTHTGMLLGTPQYLAPEQAHDMRRIDHRADLYSLGVICYKMLTGELPFSGDSAFELVLKHVQEAPCPPRKRRPDLAISQAFEHFVMRAMEKRPEDRFASAEEMQEALPDESALIPNNSTSPSVTKLWPQTTKARRSLFVIAALFLFSLGGLFVLSNRQSPDISLKAISRPDGGIKRHRVKKRRGSWRKKKSARGGAKRTDAKSVNNAKPVNDAKPVQIDVDIKPLLIPSTDTRIHKSRDASNARSTGDSEGSIDAAPFSDAAIEESTSLR